MTKSQQPSLTKIKQQTSSHKGVGHWKGQRLSAVALIFLSLWFFGELIYYTQSDYHTVMNWAAQPWIGAAFAIFLGMVCYHSSLGLQVIIEDYMPNPLWQKSLILGVQLVNLVVYLLSWFFIIRIAIIAKV